ncbi:MAG TPA: riboflavin synthase [Synergistales bacterium]|jgi:riboflavin synthase|nr:riboflavin synthase [Synergistales bacterium]HRV70833.1 riboflavin synthase [Thermovirgaceae bacterium]
MFTGLIECTGVIASSRQRGDVTEIDIRDVPFATSLEKGDSVAVSGACLTVTRISGTGFSVEMMPETRVNTIPGLTSQGYRVNLERSLSSSGRFEGHIVTGHVDTVARVSGITELGRTRILSIDAGKKYMKYVPRKGSIAIQGVSLTVIDSSDGIIRTGLIPETLSRTTLGDLEPGSAVNLEFDILCKYIEGLLSGNGTEPEKGSRINLDYLGEIGWA